MVPKHPKKPFFFFFLEQQKHPISTKILPIHAILTKSCDKISGFYSLPSNLILKRRKHEKNPFTLSLVFAPR